MITILIIDNDPDTRATIESWSDGSAVSGLHEFLFASTDADALRVIGGPQPVDMVVINIDAEELSGMELFLRVEKKDTRFPRIALTGGADLHRIRGAMADGAVEFILKPLVLDDMMETVGRVFAQVERRRKNWIERADYMALRREISAAAEMQNRFLPKTFPQFDGLDVFARTKPARDVGGDFFDVISLDADRVMVLVADVAGKSVPAAFYMAISRTLLHTLVIQGASPGDCLAQANAALCSYEIPGMFVSVMCVLMDTVNRTICYSDGGHLPFLMRHGDSPTPTRVGKSGGPVLGVVQDATYAEETIQMTSGDCLLLYSDGISEAFNEDRIQYGMDRLVNCFARNTHQSAKAVAMSVFDDVESHASDLEQSDDITVLCVRMR